MLLETIIGKDENERFATSFKTERFELLGDSFHI